MPPCSARDLIDRDALVQAAPTITVRQAAERMAEHRCGSVLVVEDERLVGIFTAHDLLTRVVARARGLDRTRLGEVMTRDPAAIAAGASATAALRRTDELGCSYLAVVEAGRVIGVLSRSHLLLTGVLQARH